MSDNSLATTLDIAVLVANALELNGGEYFIGGSLASSLQGNPRATNDIDFVISLPLGRVHSFRECLGADFELDTDMLRDALRHARSANAFYLPVVMKIDFFGRGYDGFDEVEFARRRKTQIAAVGTELYLKSPEDSVLRKLLWYRDGGCASKKQWSDVVAVLRVSRDEIDADYLANWANSLGVVDLLQKAQRESKA